jgi:hypothetical protein
MGRPHGPVGRPRHLAGLSAHALLSSFPSVATDPEG